MQNTTKLLDVLSYGVSPLLKSNHKWARDLYKKSAANNWTPLDTPSGEDIRQWSDPKGLTDDERHLVKRTLGQFSAGESLVSNAITLIESKFITDGAVRDLLSRKAFEECLTKDHEIFTTDGWVDINKITTEHTVLGVALRNPESGDQYLQMVWEQPKKVINYPNYSGKLYSVGFKNHKFTCTSHHRCLISPSGVNPLELVYAKDLSQYKPKHNSFQLKLENLGYTGELDDFSEINTMLLQPIKTREKEYKNWNKTTSKSFVTQNNSQTKFDSCKNLSKANHCNDAEYFQLLAFSLGYTWVLDPSISNINDSQTKFASCKNLPKANHCNGTAGLKRVPHTKIECTPCVPLQGTQEAIEGTLSSTEVYCIELSSGMFVARNKTSGLPFITGNSVHNWTAETCCEWFSLDIQEVAEAYKNIPSIATKEKFIMKSMRQFDDMKNTTDPENIRAFIRNIFIIYMIVEGTWFISNFVALLSLKRRQKLPALGTQILYTWTDECNHVELGVNLLNILKEEYPEEYITKDEMYFLMDEALEIEKIYIDDIIPRGLTGLSSQSLKDHAEYIANINLMKLDLSPRYKTKSCPISWLEEVQGEKVSAFFEVRATNYVTTAELDDDF